MILELRQVKPFVHFGFNKTSEQAFIGDKINVYLKTLYNSKEYFDTSLILTGGGSVKKINSYHYEITYSGLGSKTIKLKTLAFNRKLEDSNVLDMEVVCRNNYIFSDPCNSQYIPNL